MSPRSPHAATARKDSSLSNRLGQKASGSLNEEGIASASAGRILQSAAALFSEKGYEATSIRDIISAAGVSRPVLYYHFKSKERLYMLPLLERRNWLDQPRGGICPHFRGHPRLTDRPDAGERRLSLKFNLNKANPRSNCAFEKRWFMHPRTIVSPGAWMGLIIAIAAMTGCKGAPPPRGPVEVGTVTIRPERVLLTTELPGRTSPYLVAEIRPQVNGIVKNRAFEEGGDVKAGSLLYQVDPAPYQAAFDQAKAAYEMAKANLPAARAREDRLKTLVAVHAVGQQDYDDALSQRQQAEANAAQAKAAMDAAQVNLAYTTMRAPISGRIGRASVTVGALVNAYQLSPLAMIQQLDPIYVDVTQSSADLLRLRRAMESGRLNQGSESRGLVRLHLEDGTFYKLEGTLEFRDVTVDPSTGSVILRMVFPNPDHVLLPGMFVRAVVEEGANEKAILAPQQGIARDPKGNPFAWVVDASEKVEQRTLDLDRAIGDKWLVTKGLAPGDRVIVEGLQKVRPGDAVKATPFSMQTGSDKPTGNGRPAAEVK